jgi:hypothetical protein
LSVERLITQLEITTSTESAGSGMLSISPFKELDVRGTDLVRARSSEKKLIAAGLCRRFRVPGDGVCSPPLK